MCVTFDSFPAYTPCGRHTAHPRHPPPPRPSWLPGSNRAKTSVSELSTIFQILTVVLLETFPKTMCGSPEAMRCKSLICQWLRAQAFPNRSVFGKVFFPGEELHLLLKNANSLVADTGNWRDTPRRLARPGFMRRCSPPTRRSSPNTGLSPGRTMIEMSGALVDGLASIPDETERDGLFQGVNGLFMLSKDALRDRLSKLNR
jgi:hypothetical protein